MGMALKSHAIGCKVRGSPSFSQCLVPPFSKKERYKITLVTVWSETYICMDLRFIHTYCKNAVLKIRK